jgi:hypothetical protein
MGGLPALLISAGAAWNIVNRAGAAEAMKPMGYGEHTILPLSIVTIICGLLYLIPATSVLGAILLTGYLGGAVATHVIHGDPLIQVLFPSVFGALFWGGLWLRDRRVRALIPCKC